MTITITTPSNVCRSILSFIDSLVTPLARRSPSRARTRAIQNDVAVQIHDEEFNWDDAFAYPYDGII
jgi:hypothetical protein